MTGITLEFILIGLLLAFLLFLSVVESAVALSSPLALRVIMERDDKPPSPMFQLVVEDKLQLIVPLHFGIQISSITIAILSTHLCLTRWGAWGVLYAFPLVLLVSVVFRQLLPRLATQNEPEEKLVYFLKTFGPLYGVLRHLAYPLSSMLTAFKQRAENGETPGEEAAEATGEEIQAYLEIGEDQGILQEEDTKLIQSVVDFGDTLVREVMTPRTKIVACDETASLAELRDMMVQHRHSRIPIYHEDIDHIIGIAYIRQLMAELAKGRDADQVASLVRPAPFVPETKPVSTLLKELQEQGDHTAIVIDEFGGVAGLVTIEDLIEEIVGEIRDEDQAKVSEIVEENAQTYVFRGSTEIDKLEEVAGKTFEEGGYSTVAGLIVSFLGRVPAPGEEFDYEGLRVQILDADRRRIHKMRIQLPKPQSIPQDKGKP